jgi:hypothetical protein
MTAPERGTRRASRAQMHPDANVAQHLCTLYRVSRSRQTRRSKKARRHAAYTAAPPREVVREATRVERLAYTRTQAAEALGVSRSTFSRRVLPLIETVEMPWGTRLVPVDELQRFVAERRRPARTQPQPRAPAGRPPVVPEGVVKRIRERYRAGQTLAAIARELTADGIPTAHGGARWWPSTVRSILRRDETQPSDMTPITLRGRRAAK